MFPTKKKDPKAQAMRDKIGKMSSRQRGLDLEQSWKGKQPSSGYQEQFDPNFGAGADDADGDEQLSASDPSVNYMSPDQGPFACSNCTNFVADGQPCKKVSDPVQSEGYCSLFESAAGAAPQVDATAQPDPGDHEFR